MAGLRVGPALRAVRNSSRLSRKELAKRSGVAEYKIYNVENGPGKFGAGKKVPSPMELEKLFEVCQQERSAGSVKG